MSLRKATLASLAARGRRGALASLAALFLIVPSCHRESLESRYDRFTNGWTIEIEDCGKHLVKPGCEGDPIPEPIVCFADHFASCTPARLYVGKGIEGEDLVERTIFLVMPGDPGIEPCRLEKFTTRHPHFAMSEDVDQYDCEDAVLTADCKNLLDGAECTSVCPPGANCLSLSE